jgi:hypothetical protein
VCSEGTSSQSCRRRASQRNAGRRKEERGRAADYEVASLEAAREESFARRGHCEIDVEPEAEEKSVFAESQHNVIVRKGTVLRVHVSNFSSDVYIDAVVENGTLKEDADDS